MNNIVVSSIFCSVLVFLGSTFDAESKFITAEAISCDLIDLERGLLWHSNCECCYYRSVLGREIHVVGSTFNAESKFTTAEAISCDLIDLERGLL